AKPTERITSACGRIRAWGQLRSAIAPQPAAQTTAGFGGRLWLASRRRLGSNFFEDPRRGFLLGGGVRFVDYRFRFLRRVFFGRFGSGFLYRGFGVLGLRLIGLCVIGLRRIGFFPRRCELLGLCNVVGRCLRHVLDERLCFGCSFGGWLFVLGGHLIGDGLGLLGGFYFRFMNLRRSLQRLDRLLTLDDAQACLGFGRFRLSLVRQRFGFRLVLGFLGPCFSYGFGFFGLALGFLGLFVSYGLGFFGLADRFLG